MECQADRKQTEIRGSALARGEVTPVSPLELGVAFTLFRRAALDEMIDDAFEPLTDSHASASVTDEGRRRGMMILKLHFDQPDAPTAIMKRIEAFVCLLIAMEHSADVAWFHFCRRHDRFVPIVHAIAWCRLSVGETFEMAEFMEMATKAPLSLTPAKGALSVN